ncbi:MAG: hypothetical protein ACNA76_09325 [Anaerosomatales bacterium]
MTSRVTRVTSSATSRDATGDPIGFTGDLTGGVTREVTNKGRPDTPTLRARSHYQRAIGAT